MRILRRILSALPVRRRDVFDNVEILPPEPGYRRRQPDRTGMRAMTLPPAMLPAPPVLQLPAPEDPLAELQRIVSQPSKFDVLWSALPVAGAPKSTAGRPSRERRMSDDFAACCRDDTREGHDRLLCRANCPVRVKEAFAQARREADEARQADIERENQRAQEKAADFTRRGRDTSRSRGFDMGR